jgi:hypothetical protein
MPSLQLPHREPAYVSLLRLLMLTTLSQLILTLTSKKCMMMLITASEQNWAINELQAKTGPKYGLFGDSPPHSAASLASLFTPASLLAPA